MDEQQFYVWNETDGILAAPEPMPAAEAEAFMASFPERFRRQGYYKTAEGERIPVSDLKLRLMSEEEI